MTTLEIEKKEFQNQLRNEKDKEKRKKLIDDYMKKLDDHYIKYPDGNFTIDGEYVTKDEYLNHIDKQNIR